MGIIITGGHEAHENYEYINVPKKELVSSLIAIFQMGKIAIPKDLPDAKTLIEEMLSFNMRINKRTGNESYEAFKANEHDDTVMAMALGVWYAEREKPNLNREPYTEVKPIFGKGGYW